MRVARCGKCVSTALGGVGVPRGEPSTHLATGGRISRGVSAAVERVGDEHAGKAIVVVVDKRLVLAASRVRIQAAHKECQHCPSTLYTGGNYNNQ